MSWMLQNACAGDAQKLMLHRSSNLTALGSGFCWQQKYDKRNSNCAHLGFVKG